MIRQLLDYINCPGNAADLINDIQSVCRGKDLSKVEARLTFGHEGPCLAFYVVRDESPEEIAAAEARDRATYETLKERFG